MRRLRAAAFLLLLPFLLSACATSTAPIADRSPDFTWQQWPSYETAGYSPEQMALARKHAEEVKSAAVMTIVDGVVLNAWGDVDRKLELHSVRKSLYSALYGIAVERGLIDLYATLADLGIDDLQPLTSTEKTTTVGDLVASRSGVYHEAAYAPSSQEKGRPERGSHLPGTHWFYNNWDFNVAGVLLERATGKPMAELFEEWIAAPIGMQDYTPSDVFEVWEPGRSRYPALTFRMSTRDLARFGQLWLNEGRWNGRQIIPAQWVADASMPISQTFNEGQGYGRMWWTWAPGALNAERYPNLRNFSAVQASGTGGQAIIIVPELDLVYVHRGDTDHAIEVGGRDVWGILEKIVAAKEGPGSGAPIAGLREEPFAGQPDPLVWPRVVRLSEEEKQALTGRYDFGPVTATIYVHDGRLIASMPGQGEAEIFPVSPTKFFLRVEPTASIDFRLDENGRAEGIDMMLFGREMKAERVD
ncbi:MAG: serine hydrolase [Acidobacteria bacterium]|nr:serine hydrolase [Acidobacteriota bacterium]